MIWKFKIAGQKKRIESKEPSSELELLLVITNLEEENAKLRHQLRR